MATLEEIKKRQMSKKDMLTRIKSRFNLNAATMDYLNKNYSPDAVFRNIFSYKGPKAGSGIPPAVKKAKTFVAKKYGEATQGRPFTKKQANIPAAQAKRKAIDKMKDATKKAPTKKSHNIVRGDTLSQIAEKYGTTVATLKKLNNIKDVNKIRAGSTLKLPDSAKKRTTKPVPTPKSRPQMYTLKSGKKGTYEQRMQEIRNEKLQKQIKKAIQTKKRAGKYGR